MDFTSFVLQFGFCIYKILIHKNAESIDFTMNFQAKARIILDVIFANPVNMGTPVKSQLYFW